MAWLEITLNTESRKVEAVAEALTARGFSDLVIEDQQEFETFLEENRAYWDYIDEKLQQQLQGLSRIKLYLEDTDAAGLNRVRTYAEQARLDITVAPLAETNWEESWKDSYPPQEVGENLVVLPYWLAEDYEGARKAVILDPGLTFGTGAHPSTQMVMETMEHTVKQGDTLWAIAKSCGLSMEQLLKLNPGIKNPDLIRVGEKVRVS